MNKRLQREEIKLKCAEAIGVSGCFVCGCTKHKKGMTIHHLEYIFNDVTYNLPKYKPTNDSTKLAYYTDLLPLVVEIPARFMYLCNPHHQALERLNRFNPETIVSLLEALLLTKTNPKQNELAKLLKVMVGSFNHT